MKRSAGFTLVELMVTVAVLGILASIAWPSYQQYVRKARQAEAKAALLENAQFLERNFTQSNRYHTDAQQNPVLLPVTQTPRDAAAVYAITLVATATTYQLKATPVADGGMAGDACGTFVLNQLGQRTLEGATVPVGSCW
jgi:type IV pilus assembly protein PilE